MNISAVSLPAPSKAEKIYEASHSYGGFIIAELRAAFIEVADAEDWRRPFQREVRKADVERLKAAVMYFHADESCVADDQGDPAEMAGSGLQRWQSSHISGPK